MSIQSVIVMLTFVTSMTACFILASMYIKDSDGYRGARVLTVLILVFCMLILVAWTTHLTFFK